MPTIDRVVSDAWKARAEAAEANLARAREIMKPFAIIDMFEAATPAPSSAKSVEGEGSRDALNPNPMEAKGG